MNGSATVLAVRSDGLFEEVVDRLDRGTGLAVRTVDDPSDASRIDADLDAVVGCSELTTQHGIAAIETLRERRPELPVVVLHDDVDAAKRALDAGASHLVRIDRDPAALAEETIATLESVVGTTPVRSDGDRLVESAVDRLRDVVFIFDLDGTMLRWNDRLLEVTGYDDETIAEMVPTEFVTEADRPDAVEAIQDVVERGEAQRTIRIETADGTTIPYEFTGALLREDGEPVAITGVGRDISERRRRERTLERQAERLETLNHVNAVIRDVTQALVRAETRDEIESEVCEGLAAAEPYEFAWIGEFGVGRRSVEPRAAAGSGKGYLDDRPNDPDDGVTAATAITKDEVTVAQNIAERAEWASWRDAALERGFRSAAAVPLSYRGLSYGVLCVYAPRSNAFDETEREVLSELGETIAYAINAAERRRALVSDTVTELELELAPPGPFVVGASVAANCEVTLDGVVEIDGDVAGYVHLPDDALPAVEEYASSEGAELTVVGEYDDEVVVRVVSDDPMVANIVADQGGVLTSAWADSGEGVLTIELPGIADLRSAVARITEEYPGVEPRAQRERERTGTGRLEFRNELDEQLTDRQREVLEVAFFSGFFEWPRGCKAEEVAEQLDISPPTFHEHLRRVQRKLSGAFLDGAAGSSQTD